MEFPKDPQKAQPAEILRYFGSTAIPALLAILLIIVAFLLTVRVQRVSGTEFGAKVNNITGNIQIVEQPGTNIYNGIIYTFHVLDKTVQRLAMTATENRGDRPGRDDLRIKTMDGSDVFLDLTINYALRPEMVEQIVKTSGIGDAYKIKWVRDYSRSICRTAFGELTTEEFYDAGKREAKEFEARDELNGLLKPFGIEIIRVIAEDFRFHEEYQEKIRAKKLADQEVEEQISMARAAEQSQIFRTVEATKKKEVSITTYGGEMEKLVVDAKAQADKVLRNAEAYSIETKLGADASYFEKEKNAQAILATKEAEAEGMKKMSEALAGDGGRNIVRLEYTRRLKEMQFDGQPFTLNAQTERFSHMREEGAATTQRPPAKTAPAAKR